uniref:Uncharacterized protein n=1 Tax=Solibacter usitatus (strain Ellin6076) TaxID=234267 RepID=Q021W3_SOLUE
MRITWWAIAAWLVCTAAHGGQPQQRLPVYLLDRANDGYMDCTQAETLASRMFAGIGISLEWAKGKPAWESSGPPIIIEVVTRTPPNLMPDSLAYTAPNEGSHITVFLDRIEQMRAPSNVLAHVMVHEITHVLQGLSRHSAGGVMKEVWTAGDFGGMRLRPLPFTPVDIDLIHAGLAARQEAKTSRLQDSNGAGKNKGDSTATSSPRAAVDASGNPDIPRERH